MGTNAPAVAVGPKQIIGVLGAIAVVGSAFLNWADVTEFGGKVAKGTDVPVQFLVDKGTDSSSPSVLILLGIAAALIVIGLFVAAAHRYSTIAGGALALVVAVLYSIQVLRLLDGNPQVGFFDFISVGVYVALVGGAVAVVAGLMPSTAGPSDGPNGGSSGGAETAPPMPPAAPPA